ncbi:MAG: M1 family aminopeptidase, partial [Nitrospirota bacterium]|nr:M1 family aminopeptidase [Nitrospirota bacterium]
MNKLDIKVDPTGRKITGTSRISLPPEHTVNVALSGLKVIAASINDRPLVIGPGVTRITFRPETADEVLLIEYEAEFRASAGTGGGKNAGVVEGNLVTPDGVVLIDEWYPAMDGLSLFSLTAVLPREFEAVSEAEEILIQDRTETDREFSFVFPHPVRNISLIAGRYLISKDTFNETEIFAYFLPEDKGLAKTYIEYAGKYLAMYEKLLGRYPFKRFSIVENILPTGYAMPTFTLLGQDVVRLPFIVETSLGHEILHQWFGGLVYIDYESGNWSEGLTTYLADHMYREMKGTGWDYRKQALISFQSYVRPENEFPLKSFTDRTGRVSAAIGYNKSAMVFHMLKNQVGEKAFYLSLGLFIKKNKFHSASWSDIRDAFESVSGEDLGWFFSQWLEGKGMPEIGLRKLEMKYTGSKASVRFELFQGPETYKLSIPIFLRFRDGGMRKNFVIDKKSTIVEIETEELPVELVIDDNYDLFRRLSDKEFPPVISRLLGDKKKIFVIPQGKAGEYAPLADYFKKEGFMDKKEEEIKYDDIKSSSFIVPGSETGMVKRLFGEIESQEGDFHVTVKNNPLNSRGVIAVIDSVSTDDMTGYVRRIPHYGGYSLVAFRDGRNILKSVDGSERGIRLKTGKEVLGIEIPRILSISDIIKKVSGSHIIYIGESHTRFEH